MTMKCKAITLI